MTAPLPLAIRFAGSGEFGLPTLKAIQASGARIVQVVTQPDRPAGRGRKLTSTPIGQYALAQGLPLLTTTDINAETLPAADVMVVIAFGQKIGPAVVDQPRLGSINLHASRLPLYRGAAPINWAILRGEATTGNSVIRLAQRMDAGDILGQSLITIGGLETAGELHDRLAIDGADLVTRVLKNLMAGTVVEQKQDDASATQAPKLTRQITQLNWQKPATELALQIRGLYPWPGCRVECLIPGAQTARLTLVRCSVVSQTNVPPGGIDALGHIATAVGSLEIVELQPEGRRPMSLEAYRRGHHWPAGARLQSIL